MCLIYKNTDLYVLFQLINRHRKVRMVVVIESYITAGLVHHGEKGAQAAQTCKVHYVLHFRGMFKGLDHKPCGSEVGLKDSCHIPLDLWIKKSDAANMLSPSQMVQ